MVMDRSDVESSPSTPDTGDDDVVSRYEGTGVSALLIALCLVAVLAVIFLAQNTASVGIDFLWLSAQAPLFVVLLSTVCVTALATLGVAELSTSAAPTIRTRGAHPTPARAGRLISRRPRCSRLRDARENDRND